MRATATLSAVPSMLLMLGLGVASGHRLPAHPDFSPASESRSLTQAATNGALRNGEPTAEEIVERAIERSEGQMERQVDAEFEAAMFSTIDTLDGDGEVTETETARYRRYSIRGALFDELVEKEGRPLTEEERREERARREEFEREVRERIAAGLSPQPEDDRRVQFDSYLMDRYETALIGEEEVRGHLCWVISMEPRAGELPERNRMDQALNRANGRLWVAQEDYGVARVEFILRDPIKYLGGFLATVRKTNGRIEIDRVEPGVWAPTEFELQLDLRVLFKNIRRVITTQWSDYRRLSIPGR